MLGWVEVEGLIVIVGGNVYIIHYQIGSVRNIIEIVWAFHQFRATNRTESWTFSGAECWTFSWSRRLKWEMVYCNEFTIRCMFIDESRSRYKITKNSQKWEDIQEAEQEHKSVDRHRQ